MPKVSVTKKWNQRTVGHLISYSNDSESNNPPPTPLPSPHFSQPSHVNAAASWRSHINPLPIQSSHANPVPARSSQVNPALADWHSIESAMCHLLNSIASIQPRDRAGLFTKQSAQTNSIPIRMRLPDTHY